MKITTILTDIGGVIARVDNERTVEALARVSPHSPDVIRACMFGPTGLVHRYAVGELDTPAFRGTVRRAFDIPAACADAEIDRAFANVFTPDRLVLELFAELRRSGLTITAVSNTEELRYARLERLGVTSIFDHEVLSFRERLAKPSVELMVRALDRSGAAAEEAVFIDDLPANLRSASAVGIATHHYADIEALVDFLSCFSLSAD